MECLVIGIRITSLFLHANFAGQKRIFCEFVSRYDREGEAPAEPLGIKSVNVRGSAGASPSQAFFGRYAISHGLAK
jgi:hypothetical protein